MFTIYPAIDLIDGKCVRLFQGDYDQSTIYGDDPVAIARSFFEQGAQWLHVVDLDGAKAGRPINQGLIARMAAEVPINIEVGGGIRSIETVESYLNQGIKRVILGSSAISDPEFCKLALNCYPEAVVIGLDVKNGKVAVRGWLDVSDLSAAELANRLIQEGAEQFIYTDISRDGALQGANVAAAEQLADEIGKPVVVSGGVTTLEEVKQMINNRRVSGAIIGKALYTKQIELSDVIKAVKH
ncbi:1-(5-phosphoribosyl)-5-[(5-phosphoribosylamino)methylideneamino]imidazole-4-carboxamide isomerase [Sporolactobacillus sp. STSJ-5]|uniref:1-(5-phosphoribosyl)-5-[(5- phosphoribosylamino)methylideneamino]imidazole-4- carboxamide isomerase n=1 Tax=Sporolactobacillus sp. STSJ-5 TaxID=2965076 RepID=UPI002107166F|nr:1-(5-phosphoribosyl)-5-[(5-phosphoribosylamino)methylideneamino]imidazole-4-carboxamide isomerase [Sporolactobacillus sp. STSJ-5]MCQ2008674.1 1-(5-phosphoribosyl)-5-[(5-phosphoribosylamino)methylideneamino]imidazole-4-carboxamide isomerase [Sporolactobacillus sp. STSJ-5]